MSFLTDFRITNIGIVNYAGFHSGGHIAIYITQVMLIILITCIQVATACLLVHCNNLFEYDLSLFFYIFMIIINNIILTNSLHVHSHFLCH